MEHNEKWSKGAHAELAQPSVALFARDAETIAESLAPKEVSAVRLASGMRMLTFYINRAGKRLSPSRLRNLEKAKRLLTARVEEARREEARRESR